MSKNKNHAPKPGETISFIDSEGRRVTAEVDEWDSKHGILETMEGEHIYIKDRSNIRLVEAAPTEKEVPPFRTPFSDSRRGPQMSKRLPMANQEESSGSSAIVWEPASKAEREQPAFAAMLPTSFASEVERAQAIASEEAAQKGREEAFAKRKAGIDARFKALVAENNAVATEETNAEEDSRIRIEYLGSLRVRREA